MSNMSLENAVYTLADYIGKNQRMSIRDVKALERDDDVRGAVQDAVQTLREESLINDIARLVGDDDYLSYDDLMAFDEKADGE
jgi:hypothetical protein